MNSVAETRKPKILVVDDEPVNLKLVRQVLATKPYELSFARDGKMALELCAQEAYDLILLDIMMPEMSGLEVLAELKRQDQGWRHRVIMLTALDGNPEKLQAFHFGAMDFLTKPFNQKELIARIESCLHRVTTQELVQSMISLLGPSMNQVDEALAQFEHNPQKAKTYIEELKLGLQRVLSFYQLKNMLPEFVNLSQSELDESINEFLSHAGAENSIVNIQANGAVTDPILWEHFLLYLGQFLTLGGAKIEQVDLHVQEHQLAFTIRWQAFELGELELRLLNDSMAHVAQIKTDGLLFNLAYAGLLADKLNLAFEYSCDQNTHELIIRSRSM